MNTYIGRMVFAIVALFALLANAIQFEGQEWSSDFVVQGDTYVLYRLSSRDLYYVPPGGHRYSGAYLCRHDLTSVTLRTSVSEGGYYWPCEYIAQGAFSNAPGLQTVVIPSGYKRMYKPGFKGLSSLTSVSLPSTLLDYPDEVFSGCTSIKTVVLPNGVTRIPNDAFKDCGKLSSVTLPSSIRDIGDSAFEGCGALLMDWSFPNITNISARAFVNCHVGASFAFGENLGNIGTGAFSGTAVGIVEFGGLPPQGLAESGIFTEYPEVIFPDALAEEWNNALSVLPHDMTVSISVVENGATYSVALSTMHAGDRIRYTIDGSEPNIDSAVYSEPFLVNPLQVEKIKARVVVQGWPWNKTSSAIIDCPRVDAPVIEPSGAEFENVSQTVSLSCATDGATILYTTDGSDPKVNGREYTKSFAIYKSCTVRAIAVKYDWKDSAEATATFTRGETLS